MSLPTALVSESEFLALPESNRPVELIDGEVLVWPSPGPRHQSILQRLVRALMNWADQQQETVVVGQAPWDVRFGRDRILQPDAFVLLAPLPPGDGPLAVIPDLCIEVLSKNRVHDRVTKRFIYAREYWVVDPAGHIEIWTGEGLSGRRTADAALQSPLLPVFALELKVLFSDLPG